MTAPKATDTGQKSISSFFKPSQSSQPTSKTSSSKRRPSNSSEVIILDSSDSDDSPPPARPVKQLKLEHPSDSDLPHLPPQPPPVASTFKISAAERVSKWRFDEDRPAFDPPPPTQAETARRKKFASKLLAGPNLLKRKSAYLQADDHLAAKSEASGSRDSDAGDEGDEEYAMAVEQDEEQPTGKGKAKGTAKGAASAETTSRFSQFKSQSKVPPTAKEKGKAKAAATATGVKYTPLEKQVLELKKKYPGVVLLFEVGYKYRFFEEDLKKVSDNKSAPFTRALSHLYTSATYIDELHVDPLESARSTTATLMCLVEEVPKDGEKVKIGMLAVVPSTEFEDGHMRSEIETRMLHLQPVRLFTVLYMISLSHTVAQSELLLQQHMSKQTESMVAYLIGQDAGAGGFTCRIERIAKKPTTDAAQTFVADFYIKAGKPEEAEIVIDDEEPSTTGGNLTLSELHKILDLPKSVLIALTALIRHLGDFSLETVFLHKTSFVHFSKRSEMNLNGNTLANLEILRNQTDYKEKGSLLSILDHCKTAFGRRQLRRWVSKPLVSLTGVQERQDAISEILACSGKAIIVRLRELFRGLPDLERGLVRIHFKKSTPVELVKVLQGFKRVADVFGPGSSDGVTSPLLKRIVASLPSANVDNYLGELNLGEAKEGKKADLFKESDAFESLQDAKDCLVAVEYEMKDELDACRKLLKKPALEFVKVAQEEFLIEVRINESKKIVPDSWVRINSTKAVYRFRSPKMQKKMAEIEQSRERVAAEADVAFKEYLARVSESYEVFRSAIANLATADCLFSLATAAASPGYCRPQITSEPGILDIVQGRHPMVEVTLSAPFVPNDVSFGGDDQKQMIVTGLNMGGKSSLSRSVALIALMAQIGSYVPADSCKTSLFDGIYTRLFFSMGASDELARGRSTFMVELSETSEILKLATRRSLVILDELGRGTSTMDGQAIAGAVLQYIVEKLHCLTLFITHYPQLGDIARTYPEEVKCYHMACLEEEQASGVSAVTFLYKLKPGLASRSHGLNVARMAELPDSVLARAFEKAHELEMIMVAKAQARVCERLKRVLLSLASSSEMDQATVVELCSDAAAKVSS
ncbi:DNA mismatch repair protein MSH3, partial [Phenoliferia sp. Uapishka_3]